MSTTYFRLPPSSPWQVRPLYAVSFSRETTYRKVTALPAVSPDLDARERGLVELVLRTARLAYVAMVDRAGGDDSTRPYVVPMNFAYESPSNDASEGRLLLHTGPGRKVDALSADPHVCVSVTAEEELKLGPTPCEDGYLYLSVLLEGRAVQLTDEPSRDAALRAIVAKYDPEAAGKPFEARIFAQTLLYAVEVETIGFKERPKQG